MGICFQVFSGYNYPSCRSFWNFDLIHHHEPDFSRSSPTPFVNRPHTHVCVVAGNDV